jgi:hypothetical protein
VKEVKPPGAVHLGVLEYDVLPRPGRTAAGRDRRAELQPVRDRHAHLLMDEDYRDKLELTVEAFTPRAEFRIPEGLAHASSRPRA